MANTFKNAAKAITTTSVAIYTCPANATAVIHAIYITNVDGVNQAETTIELYDSTQTTAFKVGFNLPLPIKSTLVFEKPINLEANDELRLSANVDGDVEAVVSVLEIT